MKLFVSYLGVAKKPAKTTPPDVPPPDAGLVMPTSVVLDKETGKVSFELAQPPSTLPLQILTFYLPVDWDQTRPAEDVYSSGAPYVLNESLAFGTYTVEPPDAVPDGEDRLVAQVVIHE